MADHVRKQLRDAVTTAVTGLVTTAANVFGFRVNAIQAGELPCLAVHTPSDSTDPGSIHSPQVVDRRVEVRVDGFAKAVANVDDTLDQIAKEVETALAAGVTIGGTGVELVYQGCAIRFEPGDKPVGVIEMEFSANLFTAANAPDVLL